MRIDFDNIEETIIHNFKDGETISLKEDDVHYCPKGHTHSLINDSDADLGFSAVVPQQ